MNRDIRGVRRWCVWLWTASALAACGGKVTQEREGEEIGTARDRATATFRAGVASYSGSDDVHITNQNGGNGVVERTGSQVIAWKKTGTDPYEAESLIRFNGLSLPAGAHVTSAQLTLTFENWWTGFTLRGYYVKNAWNAAPGAPLGWQNRDTGLTWSTPGATGMGTDVHSGTSFSNSSWVGNGDEAKTFDLDPAIVQGWLDSPQTNQGVLLVNNESADRYLRIYSSEDATVSRRPLLTINYDVGGDPPADPGSHPRLFLDSAALTTLRQRAQQGSAQWTQLRNVCSSYDSGVVNGSGSSCSAPNICAGYQGEDYIDPAMSIGLCYQVGLGIGDPNTATWGAKGAAILSRMAEFTSFSTDSGYGIRNYGVTMAIGYDWFYPALSASQKSAVYGRLNEWVSWYEQNGFVRNDPHANYFAGYYATKAYVGLATEGDNPSAAATWNDFLGRVHGGGAGSLGTHAGVASYYTGHLSGGGWTEGWQYGAQGIRSMSLPALAARTAKGLDLIGDPSVPFAYPLANAMHLMQFSWPSRDYLDDRDTIRHTSSCPGNARPSSYSFAVVSAMLAKWSDAIAPRFHRFARDVRTAAGAPQPWVDFLFWDEAATEADYATLPRSFLAKNYAAMRTDWNTTATWGSFRAMGYVDAPDSGEQWPDAGALAITRGSTPFLVNPGFLHRCYAGVLPTNFGDALQTEIYSSAHPNRIFNTFYNGTAGQLYGAAIAVDKASPPLTRVSRFEDRNGYVLVRGQDLEDVYPAASNVTGWARDVVFFRPSTFVTYDRTTVANTSGDQHLSWHFPPLPTAGTAPSAGARRYDVTDAAAGYKGALTTLLPANANVSVVNVFSSSKLYRVEVRPVAAATDSRWLTVLDASPTAGGVALGSVVASSANVKGALLTAATGNRVALFGAGAVGQTVTGAVTFTEPAAATKVVVADLAPNTAYAVAAPTSGTNHNVTIQPGTGFTTSANGTLYVDIAANGAVAAGN